MVNQRQGGTMTMHRTKPLSENKLRKRYRQIVSRKRKYTRFEIESWKRKDADELKKIGVEERRSRLLRKELDGLALQHFREI